METKNTPKIARLKPAIDADDRLSSLPDEIISHILSFLQTKHAVGTAVLSRRWKHLWTRVSSLDLDNSLIYKPLDRSIALRSLPPDEQLKYQGGKIPVPDPVSEIPARRDLEFCRFVYRVLSQHENLDSLRRFRFHFLVMYLENKKASPDFWFERELVFGPLLEEIDVRLSGETEFGLPQCMRCLPQSFYTLKNLEVVKLAWVTLSAANQSVFLPSLKMLELSDVRTEDCESLRRLISGCPALETARLHDCFPDHRDEEDILNISLPSLKNLSIIDCDDYDDDEMCPVVIEAPNLEDLYFCVAGKLQFMGNRPLPCLHSVHVAVGEYEGDSDHSLIGFFTRISNAKKMSLSGETLRNLSGLVDVQLPVFPNLTHLTIATAENSSVMLSLLHSAIKLQSLVIDVMENCIGAMVWDRRPPCFPVPDCLSSSLEEIVINDLDLVTNEDVMKIVACLLETGAALKKVNMHVDYTYHYYEKNGLKALASLLKLPRRSSFCEVRLLHPNNEEIHLDSDHETDIVNGDDSYDDETDNEFDTDAGDSLKPGGGDPAGGSQLNNLIN